MSTKVLVAYATKWGATEEIAQRIGEVLGEGGLDIDVLPAGRVGALTPYDAVVLGSSVTIGRWRKEAARLLKDNQETLSGMDVWLFSSGPTGEGDPVELGGGWRFPRALQPIADAIGPRDTALFHGALHLEDLNLIERWMIKNVKAPLGDFRDWDAIDQWARGIAKELAREGEQVP